MYSAENRRACTTSGQITESLISHLRLAKAPLCLLIYCSVVFGALLAQPELSLGVVTTATGVFILTLGGATMNSIQDRGQDLRMERTRTRPLVQGKVSLATAYTQAIVLIVSGLLLVLAGSGNYLVLTVSMGALLLYNGVYTPLKKRTILAIIPGALCGALPPYIGWLAAGGEVSGYVPLLIFCLFFLWQIPHYWLVMLEYKQDYLSSRHPNILRKLEENSIKRFFVTWIGGLFLVMLLFLFPPLELPLAGRGAILGNSVLLLSTFVYCLAIAPKPKPDYRFLFFLLNFSLFIHMAVISLARLLS